MNGVLMRREKQNNDERNTRDRSIDTDTIAAGLHPYSENVDVNVSSALGMNEKRMTVVLFPTEKEQIQKLR
jgi:hypothetical protein